MYQREIFQWQRIAFLYFHSLPAEAKTRKEWPFATPISICSMFIRGIVTGECILIILKSAVPMISWKIMSNRALFYLHGWQHSTITACIISVLIIVIFTCHWIVAVMEHRLDCPSFVCRTEHVRCRRWCCCVVTMVWVTTVDMAVLLRVRLALL